MRKAIARVAGPQLFIPCNSYLGEGIAAWGGGGKRVGVRDWVAKAMGEGGSGVKVAKGVDDKGVGILPTGSTAF